MFPDNFKWPIRIYYEDTDAGGIVYNANYLKYLERARTEWLRALSIEQDKLLEQDVAFVVRHIDIDFCSAARFNQQLFVSCEIAELKRASMIFRHVIVDENDKVVVKASVTIACIKLSAMKPMAIPSDISGVILRATN